MYAYIDPRDGVPFYIGKGRGSRDRDHLCPTYLNRRTLFYNKLRKILKAGVTPIIHRLAIGLANTDALTLEAFFILAIGRRRDKANPGPLCNMTNGGEGASGFKQSRLTRRRRSESMRKLLQTDEARATYSAASKARWLSPEYRRTTIQARRLANQTGEFSAKRASHMRNAYKDPVFRAKMSAAIVAGLRAPESVAKASASSKARWRDPTYAERVRVTLHRRGPKSNSVTGYKGVHVAHGRPCYSIKIGDIKAGAYGLPSFRHAARVYDALARFLHAGDCYVNIPQVIEWWEN